VMSMPVAPDAELISTAQITFFSSPSRREMIVTPTSRSFGSLRRRGAERHPPRQGCVSGVPTSDRESSWTSPLAAVRDPTSERVFTVLGEVGSGAAGRRQERAEDLVSQVIENVVWRRVEKYTI
jgi:hypothetical protein